jgi:uncharacterized delta-60 repeat protein
MSRPLASLLNWFRRSLHAVQPGSQRGRRLRLEALEDRTLLSPGDLDPAFGSGGKVTTMFPPGGAEAYSVALQPDGRIVAAGYAAQATTSSVALARYNSDGSLDSSFGSSGLVTTDFPGFGTVVGRSVAVQADGRILVAGNTYMVYQMDAGARFALARYNSDGSLDTSFGDSGVLTTAFPGFSGAVGYGVAVQPDGRIVVAGLVSTGNQGVFGLARYTPDGSLDSSFGTGGLVTTAFGGYSGAYSVALQADGRIVAAGDAGYIFALARYNSDGSLDSSFGSSGRVTAMVGGMYHYSYAWSVAVQPDGRILAGGTSYNSSAQAQFGLARFTATGSPDSSFGGNGQVTTSFGGSTQGAYSVAVQTNGRILAAGYTNGSASGTSYRFALARYDSNGSLDTSFGTGGKVTTSFGGYPNLAYGAAVQSDGQIVVAGYAEITSHDPYGFALARYEGDGGATSLTTLTSSAASSVYGRSVTLTATVTDRGQPVTGGSVTFTDGSTVLQTVNVDGSGHAAYTTTALTAAGSPHHLTATYDGGGGGGSSLGTFQQVITPAPLTIRADDKTKVAGDPVPTLTANYSGFVNGDTPDDLTTPVSLSSYSGDTAGSYPIVPSRASSPNYRITFVNGTLTVNAAAAVALQINAPAAVTAGQPFDMTVAAVDPYGNVDTNYVGSFHLGILPEDPDLGISAFTPDDHGVVSFAGFGLYQAGVDTIVASGDLYGQADLTVNPGVAVSLVLSGPSNATAGVPFSVTVTAYDTYGNVATGYAGTVTFSSDDPAAGLPADYAFQPADQGTQTFQVTLFASGTHRVSVTDTLDPSLSSDLFVTL